MLCMWQAPVSHRAALTHLKEAWAVVVHPQPLAQGAHQLRHLPQAVPGHAREQVVLDLELDSSWWRYDAGRAGRGRERGRGGRGRT